METPREWTRWLREAHEGGPEARAQLLTWCRSHLKGLKGFRIPRDCQAKGDAEDLIQETLRSFDHEFDRSEELTPEEVLGLLWRIRERTWQDFLRHHHAGKRDVRKEQALTEVTRDGTHVTARDLSPLDTMIRQEDLDQLAAALERLPAKYREVVRLRYTERLSFAEIGNRLDITEQAVKRRHRKARELLRRDLESRE